MPRNRATYAYVFSTHPFGDIYSYALEYGKREKAGGGLASLSAKKNLGKFDFRRVGDDNYYFYRAGVSYCPALNRDDCLTMFSSNKVLTESYVRPPRNVASTNIPLF